MGFNVGVLVEAIRVPLVDSMTSGVLAIVHTNSPNPRRLDLLHAHYRAGLECNNRGRTNHDGFCDTLLISARFVSTGRE